MKSRLAMVNAMFLSIYLIMHLTVFKLTLYFRLVFIFIRSTLKVFKCKVMVLVIKDGNWLFNPYLD